MSSQHEFEDVTVGVPDRTVVHEAQFHVLADTGLAAALATAALIRVSTSARLPQVIAIITSAGTVVRRRPAWT